MPTKNPRINITVEESTIAMLTKLAQKENKSVASLTKELIFEAVERREDMALSAIAEHRDSLKSKKVKQEDAWK